MMQQYMKELEQSPFDSEEFVERLAWRVIAEVKKDQNDFEPEVLFDSFQQTITDLTLLYGRQQKKCNDLETVVREQQNMFVEKIQSLKHRNNMSIEMSDDLNDRLSYVSDEILKLGEQLTEINEPRSRLVEAQQLMNYLSELLSNGASFDSVLFSDNHNIDEAASIIQKLYLISQDLPPNRFDIVKKKIEQKYEEIQKSLIEEFLSVYQLHNIERMKKISSILSQFKNYSQCIEEFIEQSQAVQFSGNDVFAELLFLCERYYELINQVFDNREQVMSKFVSNIYRSKLQIYISGKLSDNSNSNKYLTVLCELYLKAEKFTKSLEKFKMGKDESYLTKLKNNLFENYLENYISLEMKNFYEQSNKILQKYYENKGHQKKQIQSGGFQDLRRDLQAVIGKRANINIVQIEDYGGETFLSDEIAILILHESKLSLERCKLLSKSEDLENNATKLFDYLLQILVTDHVDYAVELGIQAVPIGDTKSPPNVYIFTVINQANSIIHLIEKHFVEVVLPLVKSSSKCNDCLYKKKFVLEQVESKINTGLERSINSIMNWIRIYLQNEQKKTDFKPDTDDLTSIASQACKTIVHYMNSVISELDAKLDDANLKAIKQELGIRFHRIVYEHLCQFQFNSAGSMIAICDVNDYKHCVQPLGPLVSNLFDILHALCNLLLVKHENLQQVFNGDHLVDLERSILMNFVQLRDDFKQIKLSALNI